MLMMEERRRTQINMMAWAIMMVIVIVLELRGWGGGAHNRNGRSSCSGARSLPSLATLERARAARASNRLAWSSRTS